MYAYCLFCVTQRCKVIAKLMEIRGAARAFSPQIVRRQRKQGENRDVTFDLLPGYVFIFSEEKWTDYRQFFGMDGVIRRVGRRDDGYELEGADLDFAMRLLEKDGLVGAVQTCVTGDTVTLSGRMPSWLRPSSQILTTETEVVSVAWVLVIMVTVPVAE